MKNWVGAAVGCNSVYLAEMSSLHGGGTGTRAAPRAQSRVHLTGQTGSQQQPGQVGFLEVHLKRESHSQTVGVCVCGSYPHVSLRAVSVSLQEETRTSKSRLNKKKRMNTDRVEETKMMGWDWPASQTIDTDVRICVVWAFSWVWNCQDSCRRDIHRQ